MLKQVNRILYFTLFMLLSLDAQADTGENYFTASESCPLYSTLQKSENVGEVDAVIGKQYPIINSAQDDFIHVQASGEYPENRWVKKSCGFIEEKNQIFTGPTNGTSNTESNLQREVFQPFFVDTKCKVTNTQPLAPHITRFDKDALKSCGAWGNTVKYVDLNILFSGKALKSIYEELDGTVVTPNASLDVFAKELINIWLGYSAFEHVICGQPGKRGDDKLGGLHYVGRYLEVQKNSWGGINEDCEKTEIVGPVYTIGVDFITPKSNVATKCPSGYNYNMNVYHIIVEGTKAFKEVYKQQGDKGSVACIYHNKQGDYVFVKRDDVIVTFYPDASPNPETKSCQDIS